MNMQRYSWYIEDAMARVPPLGTAWVRRLINGPIPYAPDGLSLLGPMPGVPNAFEVQARTFGIVQAGGTGKVLVEWLRDGQAEWYMWAADPRRKTGYADEDDSRARALETYGHECAMHSPITRGPRGAIRRLYRVGAGGLVRRAGRRHVRGRHGQRAALPGSGECAADREATCPAGEAGGAGAGSARHADAGSGDAGLPAEPKGCDMAAYRSTRSLAHLRGRSRAPGLSASP
ncbi:conserved hypothetical protein [Dinoroseobacter shibae DFL 12 = DSM 16493]|uniref:Uncharacterized protein n=1 Tax=Dinoroseobacter shibae (strain DSM 16493 / NCIMB 14021 / DFL 12) TaxID=398580 RepID=C5ZZE1_DINSH|nr:conserved hypothetical protein [Dinoroseobacter shibae DFL 12 = DSM 16493]